MSSLRLRGPSASSRFGMTEGFSNKYRTAVFNPLKLKFRSPEFSMLRGNSNFFASPFCARISISGPPG